MCRRPPESKGGELHLATKICRKDDFSSTLDDDDIQECEANNIHAVTFFPRYNQSNAILQPTNYVTLPMEHGQLRIFAGNEIEHMVAPVTGAVRYSIAVFLHTDTPAPVIPRK